MHWRGGNLPARRLDGSKRRTTRGMVSGRVWRDAGERWMFSCIFECGPVDATPPTVTRGEVRQEGNSIVVELDGTPPKTILVDPDERLAAERLRLKRLQRRLNRCEDGSRRKARLLERFRIVARRIRNRERDRHHKLTTTVVRAAGVIVAEGVRGEVLRQLEYKTEWHDRELQGTARPAGTGARERSERTWRPAGTSHRFGET